jgi:predicted enzyme related to lactoylglutathione lyase
MAAEQKSGAVIFAKDVVCIAKFYEEVIPMRVTHFEPHLIVLESATLQLVVHGIPARIAKSIKITSPPALRENTAIKIIIPVPSIDAVREKATTYGGGIHSNEKGFKARGFRACDGYDPEGNVVQFRESAI